MKEKNGLGDSVVISDEELKSLTDAINKRHGVDFSCYESLSLKRRIVRALHILGMQSVHELWTRILREHAFIYRFMDEISVGLTAMFRDPILWTKIKQLLREDFSSCRNLSVWHAGCSTGEEVFTMGIVLKESQCRFPCSAWATDISTQAMKIAQRGEYNLAKIRDYEENYHQYNSSSEMKIYYKVEGKNAAMDLGLTGHVRYDYHNLISGEFNRRFDIIFCRNVMIYFDNVAKRKLFERFYESLNPNGILVIGFYDAVMPMVDSSRYKVLDMEAKIFRKID